MGPEHRTHHLSNLRPGSTYQVKVAPCAKPKYCGSFETVNFTTFPSQQEMMNIAGLALNSPRALRPELQRYKDTVRCVALGAEVPGHRQQQLTQTLIVRLLKTHLFTPILDCEKSTAE